MQTRSGLEQLSCLLGSRGRALVLGHLVAREGEEVTASEVAAATDLSIPEAARQLSGLEDLGLLTSHRRGRLRLYRVVKRYPLWPELRMLAVKTLGAAGVVKEALADLDLEVAAVFGSVAGGLDTPQSDVDLLVVGDLSMADLSPALDEAERRLGREVNPALYTAAELQRELERGNPWLESVLRGKLLYLEGDEDALRSLAGAAEDQAA